MGGGRGAKGESSTQRRMPRAYNLPWGQNQQAKELFSTEQPGEIWKIKMEMCGDIIPCERATVGKEESRTDVPVAFSAVPDLRTTCRNFGAANRKG